MEQRRQLSLGGIKALEDRYQEQEIKIRKVQEEANRLRTNLNISDYEAAGTAPTPLIESDTLRRFETLRIEGEMRYIGKSNQLSMLRPLSKEQLRNELPNLPNIVPDPLLNELLAQLNVAEQRLVAVRNDYAADHPEYKRAAEQVEALNNKVNARIDGIMASISNQVASAKAEVDSLKDAVDAAKRLDQEKADKSRPYFDKKLELDNLLHFRQVLDMKIASEKIDVDLPKTAMVEVVDHAVPGLHPVRPNKPLNIALGIIIGLVVGVGLAFFIEYLDTSVKTIDDVERLLQSPVLGVIPQNIGYLIDEGSESPHAEAYRVLRTNLLFSRKDDKLNTAVVVSAGAGEGKSTTVLNIATVFAQSGSRTLVVDSDLRRPTMHKTLRVSNSLGLTNYLLKQKTLEEVIQTTSLPSLDFLPSGKLPSSSLGILSSGQMKELISELKQRYDFVFFDSPPIMGVSDASVLASEVDLTLQVIQYRRYPQPMNIRAKQMIEKVGGNLVGIVLNNINVSQDESYYYYSGYYHDYYRKKRRSHGSGGWRQRIRRQDQTGNQTKILTADMGSYGNNDMKLLRRLSGRGFAAVGCAFLAGLLFAGCHTAEPGFSEFPNAAGVPASAMDAVRFHVGEEVTVNFSGLPQSEPIAPHVEQIKEDGNITLPLVGAVKAVGKTPGELQKAIQDLYVPKFYIRATITVKSTALVYYVGGEVRNPGRQEYLGETTVTKSIQSAGDFTDFSNRKKVKLTRAYGKTITVNCLKALTDPSKDPQVFPGDKITVPRRIW